MELGAEQEYVGISAIYQFVGNAVQVISGALFYVLAAKIFPPSDLGTIALFIAIVGLFGIIFTLGLNNSITHFISSNLKSKVYSPGKILLRILFIGIAVDIAGFLSLYLLSGPVSVIFFHSVSDGKYVRDLAFVLFGNIILSILTGAIIGFERFRASAIISVFTWLIYYFGALGLALIYRSLNAIIFGWIGGLVIGITINALYLGGILARGYMKRNQRVVGSRTIFVYSLPILLSSIMSYGASYTDRLVVAYFLNTAYLGIYNFSLLIFSAITFIAIPFNNITLPKFSEFYGSNNREFIKQNVGAASLLLSYFYVPVALGIGAMAPIVLQILGGPAYVMGQYSLMIVMFVPSLFVSVNILTQAISSVRKTNIFLYSSLGGLITNLVLSFLLIPELKLTGAAIGFSSVSAVTFIILYMLAKKEDIVEFDRAGLIKIWISALIMFSIVYTFSNFLASMVGDSIINLAILIPTGMIIYVGISWKLKIFSNEQKEYIYSMFPENLTVLKRIITMLILH